MAGLNLSVDARGQFAAIARLRWQLILNSLRTLRGRFEFLSHVFMVVSFGVAGVGGAFGLGVSAWFFISRGREEWLTALLWPIFLFWQLFPLMASAFTENFDTSNLLRFPLNYRAYFFIRLAYGSLDPATALGTLWLFGIGLGTGFALPRLFPWTAVVLLAFAIFNILLARMIFAWIERWLAQRRTREILGILFFLLILSFQFIGPLVNHFGESARPEVAHTTAAFLPLERLLPPGLAAEAISGAIEGAFPFAAGAFFLLGVYSVAILWLLDLRLRAQFRGEYLAEASGRPMLPGEKQAVRLGWSLPGFPGPVAAIFEKEFRYFSRSGPMLFTLIMPIFILVIFRLAPSNSGGGDNFLVHAPDLAFPVGAAYALLILTNLVYNNFGSDGGGIQFFFVSPVRFREIVLAKNLAHSAVFGLEVVVVWIAVCLLFRPPALDVTLATLAGMLFALPVNLAVGNLLSLYAPRKIDFGTFGRQRASNTTALASFGVQIAVFAVAAATFLLARHYAELWVATLILLVLAVPAFPIYALVLNRTDRLALDRREVMIAELSRAAGS